MGCVSLRLLQTTKGCHIHVDGIELAVRRDNRGGIVFRSVFSWPDGSVVDAAVRRAKRDCLPDDAERGRSIKSIQRARIHLISHRGELRELAVGKLAELRFLERALQLNAIIGPPRFASASLRPGPLPAEEVISNRLPRFIVPSLRQPYL